MTVADDREFAEIKQLLQQALATPQLTREWGDTGGIDFEKDETQTRFQQLVNDQQHDEVEAMLKERPELALDETAFWGEGILAMPAKDGDHHVDDEYRSTPLGYAARWGHVEVVKLLLDCGADPQKSGASWSKPLAWARKKNDDEVANVLQSVERQH